MKIRSNYVSNSSSSSFIVIGYNVGNILENKEFKLDFKNKEYFMIGKYLYVDEADDFIHLTPKLLKWFEDHKYTIDVGNGDIIEIEKNCQNDWWSDCVKIPKNLKDNALAWIIKSSNNSSTTVEDLEKRYFNT